MCLGGNSPSPQAPPAPPPPPPTLDQAAPEVTSPKSSDDQKAAASGTKAYRTSLAIGTPTGGGATSSGLGISM